jgi:hypothetical protein
MSRRKFALLAAALALAVFAVGCSKNETTSAGGQASSETSPTETVSPTTISSGSTQINVGGGSLPSGFPSSFPVPDGATPAYTVSGAGGYFVWFSSSQGLDELRSFFDENLPSNGWTVDSKMDFTTSTGSYTVYLISGNGLSGGVYVGEGAPGADAFSGQYSFYVQLSPA